MRRTVSVILLTGVPALAGCRGPGTDDGVPAAPPRFELVYEKKGAHDLPREIRATLADRVVVFDVTDRFGIGAATVRLLKGSWPQEVLLRFHLRGLEGLSVAVGGKLPRRDAELDIRMLDADGNTLPGKYLDGPGYYEVRVPPALLAGDVREMKLSWVDFYRH